MRLALVALLTSILLWGSPEPASPSLEHTAEPYPGGVVFTLDPLGVSSARLVIENEWTGYQWVEIPYRDAGYVIDWNTESLAPFTGLRYYWEGMGTDMEPFWTDPQLVEAWDFSQDWQRVEGDLVTVYWYGQPARYGQRALTVAETQLARLSGELGGEIPARARVVLYQSQSDFGTTGSRSGEAQARYGVTVQWPCSCGCDDDYLFRVTIPHEITHLWLWPRRNDTPVWFQEGLAVWSEPHDHSEQAVLLSRIAPRDELLTWEQMQHRYYNDAESMSRWYAQAWGMVDYIARHYDLRALLDHLRERPNGEFECALRAVSDGLNSAQVLHAWREEVGAPVREMPSRVNAGNSDSGRTRTTNWWLVGVKLIALVALQVWRWRLNNRRRTHEDAAVLLP